MQSNLVDSLRGSLFIADSSAGIIVTSPFFLKKRMDVEKVFWRPLAMVAGSNNGRGYPFEGVTILSARP